MIARAGKCPSRCNIICRDT